MATTATVNGAASGTGSAPVSKSSMSRGQLKRKKQQAKRALKEESGLPNGKAGSEVSTPAHEDEGVANGQSKPSLIDEDDEDKQDVEAMSAYAEVFAKFQAAPEEADVETVKDEGPSKGEVIYSDDEMPSEEDSEAPKPASKRKQRKMARLSVAELKRLVTKPEVVEWTDVTATDPKLLVMIKSYRNTVPIPAHWSQKRDYLQGKRGIEKPAFQLPSYIADTGIASQRDAIKEKEGEQTLKQKTRERVQPKMGKIDIDYQKLHDAFFKFQVPPPLTGYGEMYYEGKEFETNLKEKRPGELSQELKEALSIPPLAPPPWLIAMQRFGPPPSYPNLKVAGLNAPIPEGAQWGYHPGGWGKPPTDEYGRPLYGDVYNAQAPRYDDNQFEGPISKELWGELMADEEEEEEEESEEEEDEDEVPADGLTTPAGGAETPSGLASITSTVPGGLETPDFLELRKRREASSTAEADGPRSLYQVLPERDQRVSGFLGNDRGYDVSGLGHQRGVNVSMLGQEDRYSKAKRQGDVDIVLDPSEVEGLSDADLHKRYEDERRVRNANAPANTAQGSREDLSDVVAEEGAKRRTREEARSSRREKDRFRF